MINLKVEAQKRIPGLLYLMLAMTGFYTPFVMEKFRSTLDPTQWYEAIIQHQLFFSSGILSFYLMNMTWLLLAYSLYTMFKCTNRTASNVLLLSVISGEIIVFMFIVTQSVPLFVMMLSHQNALADLTIWIERAHFIFIVSTKGSISAFVFYSIWLFPLAILFLHAKTLKKIEKIILSTSLIIAGIGYMADFLLFHVFPQGTYVKVTDFTFYGEVVVLLWLLVKGLDIDRIQVPSWEKGNRE